MKRHLYHTIVFFSFLALVLGCLSCKQSTKKSGEQVELSEEGKKLYDALLKKRVRLSNGWSVTPAGKSIPLGDFPMNLVVSPSKKLLAVTNNGQSKHSIMLIDPQGEKLLDEIEIPSAWFGLHFSQDEKFLYASVGNRNQIYIYAIDNQKLALKDSIVLGKAWPHPERNPEGQKISPTGIEIDAKNTTLYVVTKEDSSLYICDLASKKVTDKIKLNHEAYTCLLSKDEQKLYISLWGGAKIGVYDLQSKKIEKEIAVESHPNDLLITQDGKHLFVPNANSNSVSVIDLKAQKVIETFNTALFPESPAGTTSNALALSEDEKTLYVANADNNCLALFDVSKIGQSKSLGFIPVGWYPTSVKVIGEKIIVTNGKGETSLPNPKGPNPYKRRDENTQYIGSLFKGSLSFISQPQPDLLAAYSRLVYENTPYNKEKEQLAEGEFGNPIPRKVGDPSPIKYVFYFIKENRTYDQIFGDMKEGNGDTSLCLFPELVSPNHHALARQFVILDNFYVDAEVSADGHNWSTAAYATDYTEKTWPTSYGGRGGTYDYEGSRAIAFPEKGHIWDYCQRAGLSYRSYGEFVWGGEAKYPALKGHIDQDYPPYDLSIKDVDRFEFWKKDFDSLLVINQLPQFSTIRIGNDHTAGARVGNPTPRAMVADNDLALGKFVEYISKSKIWKESAIFVLEDDAQNGPDHVDAHRSPALVISPYTKRKQVVHTMYSTSAMLRTMELILGLPPMSQYDAGATPMWECFVAKPDLTPYTALKNNIDLNEMNVEENELARISASFNLSREDAAPDIPFNEVIWKVVKGKNSEMPAPRRSAFVMLVDEEEEEEGE
ncbi:MAG: beta-propeller fold lactonase family protein [Microscillaceae bacterium]|nr:beta-propeller fold lactonase family protein [Microscillaceae bacterium]